MKHSKRSPGFSLILSLTVMAGIVMLLVTVSAFVMVESRAVMNQQLATRAKLNAIVSMRLALAPHVMGQRAAAAGAPRHHHLAPQPGQHPDRGIVDIGVQRLLRTTRHQGHPHPIQRWCWRFGAASC